MKKISRRVQSPSTQVQVDPGSTTAVTQVSERDKHHQFNPPNENGERVCQYRNCTTVFRQRGSQKRCNWQKYCCASHKTMELRLRKKEKEINS